MDLRRRAPRALARPSRIDSRMYQEYTRCWPPGSQVGERHESAPRSSVANGRELGIGFTNFPLRWLI